MYHPETGHKKSLDHLIKGQEDIIWIWSFTNELGRLAQCVGKIRLARDRIKGTNTRFLIARRDIPKEAKITYTNFVCDI